MRIAFLTNITTNSRAFGGGNVHVTQVAHRLIERGHTLYTNLQREDNKHFIKLSEREFFSRGEEIDAFYIRIHGSNNNDKLTLLRKSNIFAPCIWEVNSPLEELVTRGISSESLEKYNKQRKNFAQMVDVAICVSDEMAEYARDFLGIKSTFVIPNASDPLLFDPGKKDESLYNTSRFKVLYAGSFKYSWQDIKTLQLLAKRLAEMRQKDVVILVTAEGDSTDNLIFLGNIPYREMPRYLASADVGLCLYENFNFYKKFYGSPTKLYDYMASGLPVIGTNFGQIKYVIETNKSGLLTDNSVDDLIEKILFLKNNPEVALEMGMRGRKAVIEKYNWDSVVARTESILVEAIEKRKKLLSSSSSLLKSVYNFNYKTSGLIQINYNALRHRLFKVKKGLIS